LTEYLRPSGRISRIASDSSFGTAKSAIYPELKIGTRSRKKTSQIVAVRDFIRMVSAPSIHGADMRVSIFTCTALQGVCCFKMLRDGLCMACLQRLCLRMGGLHGNSCPCSMSFGRTRKTHDISLMPWKALSQFFNCLTGITYRCERRMWRSCVRIASA
jgi:hypothetical protein